MNLSNIEAELSGDIKETQEWATQLYTKSFGGYLDDVNELYLKLQDKSRPITDAELEDILTTLPLKLISVSEKLSQFKISKEVVGITLKQKEAEFIDMSEAKTLTQKKEDANLALLEYKLVQMVYSTVVSRVDNEMNFARELIMSAKKIWDSRKSSEKVVPVNSVIGEDQNLPEYNYAGHQKSYIR